MGICIASLVNFKFWLLFCRKVNSIHEIYNNDLIRSFNLLYSIEWFMPSKLDCSLGIDFKIVLLDIISSNREIFHGE